PRLQRAVEAEPDRGAVPDAVGQVALAQRAAQPLGVARGDREDVVGIARAHVAATEVGELDRAALVLDETGRAQQREVLPGPAGVRLGLRREQLGLRELGDELVGAQAAAL